MSGAICYKIDINISAISDYRLFYYFKTMLSERFTTALTYATQLHANQVRKGSGIPYVAHLLGVASIALEYGANEDEA
ncbi:hypothetical protein GXM_03922 [Nostoc sphaeroides CCNUC1]|uniref:Uncharacterized protein n=1 Tax=Nostoc sphaeroides CCNUC1 TaxID=2653204 RepID=A0A5P8W1G7_9NOSO|nr:hypothetical protein GXM_03922 [Nostoc sphaeroides CCNUC1]